MKPLNLLIPVLVISIAMVCCSKSSDSTPPDDDDPRAAFTNKNWWGDYNDPNKPRAVARYSLEFTTGDQVVLHTIMGDSAGIFTLQNNTLTLSFSGGAMKISALVSDNNKLSQFQNLTSNNFTLLTGAISPDNTEQSVDNTTWVGEFTTAGSLRLDFKPNNQVKFEDSTYTYARKKGGVIVFSYTKSRLKSFFTIITGNTLVGNYFDGFGNYNSYFGTKQ